MFRLKIVGLAVLFFISSFSFSFAGPLEECAEYAKTGIPGQDGDLLCRKGQLLAHSSSRKTPIWVIEHLTGKKAQGDPSVNRKDYKFAPDPDLEVGKRAELKDYRKSGYDQGHMAPAADMQWDTQAMRECFYLSNMVPQVGLGFNRAIWKNLEERVRDWAIQRGELYVFTGPIFRKRGNLTIGVDNVAVPVSLYKIAYDPEKKEALAVIMPNMNLKGREIPEFIVSIRDVEQKTGLDFFSKLDQETQDKIETLTPECLWH